VATCSRVLPLTVLRRPRVADKIPPWFDEDVRRTLEAAGPVPMVGPITICRDPEDDKFLELAVNGWADLIISGDADLFSLDEVRGIPIVRARTR